MMASTTQTKVYQSDQSRETKEVPGVSRDPRESNLEDLDHKPSGIAKKTTRQSFLSKLMITEPFRRSCWRNGICPTFTRFPPDLHDPKQPT